MRYPAYPLLPIPHIAPPRTPCGCGASGGFPSQIPFQQGIYPPPPLPRTFTQMQSQNLKNGERFEKLLAQVSRTKQALSLRDN